MRGGNDRQQSSMQQRIAWYAKWRDATGEQHQDRRGLLWEDKGEPPAGCLRRKDAEAMLNQATIVQVQAWTGHADVPTTMKYMHHRSRAGDARLLSAAFRPKKKRPARGAGSAPA